MEVGQRYECGRRRKHQREEPEEAGVELGGLLERSEDLEQLEHAQQLREPDEAEQPVEASGGAAGAGIIRIVAAEDIGNLGRRG